MWEANGEPQLYCIVLPALHGIVSYTIYAIVFY